MRHEKDAAGENKYAKPCCVRYSGGLGLGGGSCTRRDAVPGFAGEPPAAPPAGLWRENVECDGSLSAVEADAVKGTSGVAGRYIVAVGEVIVFAGL